MSRVHKPATMRSEDRRLGARFRPRFRIRSCCRIKTDSVTTQRRPPGLPSRMMVTIACRKRVTMSRMRGWYQTEQAQEFRMLAEFAYHTYQLMVWPLSARPAGFGRNSLATPGIVNVDFRLLKYFPMGKT